MSKYRGSPPPDGVAVRTFDVIAPTGAEILDVTFLDSAIYGLRCHWVFDSGTKKGRSRVCHAWQGDCPHCGRDRDIWLGWCAVVLHNPHKRAVLRMGPETARLLTAHAGRLVGLRGLRLWLRLSSVSRTAGWSFEAAPLDPPSPLPAAHDIGPTLMTVLGCDALPDFRLAPDEGVVPG